MHGCASSVLKSSRQRPFVLFGQNSSKKNLDAILDDKIPTSKDLTTTAVSRNGGNFMVTLLNLASKRNLSVVISLHT